MGRPDVLLLVRWCHFRRTGQPNNSGVASCAFEQLLHAHGKAHPRLACRGGDDEWQPRLFRQQFHFFTNCIPFYLPELPYPGVLHSGRSDRFQASLKGVWFVTLKKRVKITKVSVTMIFAQARQTIINKWCPAWKMCSFARRPLETQQLPATAHTSSQQPCRSHYCRYNQSRSHYRKVGAPNTEQWTQFG
jgi:hypothetical protein